MQTTILITNQIIYEKPHILPDTSTLRQDDMKQRKNGCCSDENSENCNVDPERIRAQLIVLRHWLNEHEHINACRNEESLLFFLHSVKYDLERCKKKITRYYQMRAERIEWFADRNPFLPELQALLALGPFLPIDGVDIDQRKVIVIRTSAHDPKLHTQNNVFKVGMMVLDLLMKFEPENCARGIVAIFDMAGVKLGHALQMTPKVIKRSVDSWQTYPCQPKRLEFCNTPPHVNVVLNTFRLFMTSKMRSRIIVTRKGCSMTYQNLPKNIGGCGPTYEELTCKWKCLVEQNAAFFADYDQYKSLLKAD